MQECVFEMGWMAMGRMHDGVDELIHTQGAWSTAEGDQAGWTGAASLTARSEVCGAT